MRNQIKRQWRVTPLLEIGDWTLGIIGMGGFGMHMAQRGKGLGMYVITVDPYRADKPAAVDELLPMDRLPELLGRSDALMVACPHTVETHHLLNAETLKLVKPGAYLINVTRGGIVDESALVDALRDGRLAGAGLDVFEVEPLPEDSPLWDLEGALISPHVAGFTPRYDERAAALFARNLGHYLAGEPLLNLVRRARGY